MKRFASQVAIITGGSQGIGQAIGKRLLAEGAKCVCVFDVVEGSGPNRKFMSVDVCDESAVQAAVAQVEEEFGQVDVLVNAAGIVGQTNVRTEQVDGADFDRVLAVNLRGTFNTVKAVLPGMRSRNYGRILNVASISGKEGNAGMLAYSTSKAGVIALTKVVGKEYAHEGGQHPPSNVTCNALAPAVVQTPMVDAMPAEQVEYMLAKIPMHRTGLLEEIAATAAFITSPEASFCTGFCFDASGGRATY